MHSIRRCLATVAVDPLEAYMPTHTADKVRNICIIAHIDHGKSSLSSQLLRVGDPTNNEKEDISMLDTLAVEQERGITVKATTASMVYTPTSGSNSNERYLINLFDSPGHVDFSHEVSRSLSCVDGAIILFDSSQGIQAQTVAVYEKAKEMGLPLIPVLTKTDMPSARPLEVAMSVSELFPEFDPDEILLTSARKNEGMTEVLDAIVKKVPPPKSRYENDNRLRCKVVDSWFEVQRGVVCLLKVESGELKEGDRVSVLGGDTYSPEESALEHFSIQEVGVMLPRRHRTKTLITDQMGYAIVGMRNPRQASPGGTIVLHTDAASLKEEIVDTADSSASKSGDRSVLYASVHPTEENSFDDLVSAVERLALNDMGLEVTMQKGSVSSDSGGGPFLGPGLRIGFQGMLHVEIFRQRLRDEFNVEALVTSPKVKYHIHFHPNSRKPRNPDLPSEIVIEDLTDWPSSEEKFTVYEPMVKLRVLAPVEYAGAVMDLITKRRGGEMETKVVDERTWLFTARVPWAEVVTDFHDELKSTTAGFASYDSTEDANPLQKANLCKVEIMLNGDVVEPLSFVSHSEVAAQQGRSVCKKLQEVLPRQQFKIAVQAKAQGKIIARTTVNPYRKDVLTKSSKMVGGGDVTRKKKLLEKQKAGKKRMNTSGKVTLSQAAFNSVITK